jgi:hypothetical protein
MLITLVSDQRANADDGVVDMLEKFVPHCRAYLVIGFAVVTVGGSKAPKVRDRLDIPNDDAVWHVAKSCRQRVYINGNNPLGEHYERAPARIT